MTHEVDDAAIGERLAKLLPLLSSDKDGEVVAAVRAIGRKLEAGGKNWHWFAAEVAQIGRFSAAPVPPSRARTTAGEDVASEPSRYRRAADAAGRQAERERPQAGWSMLKRSEALAWAVLLDGQPWLKPQEAELVASTRASLHDGLAFHLTAGQKRTLSALISAAMDRGLAP